jgi:hypothetical protein
MAAMGVYDQIRSAFQDIVAPEVHALRGEIRVLDQKMVNLERKIDGLEQKLEQKIDGVDARLTVKIDGARAETMSMKGEVLAEIRRVDARIDGVDHRMDGLEREMRTAIDIRERLAALEARRPA